MKEVITTWKSELKKKKKIPTTIICQTTFAMTHKRQLQ